MEESSDLHDWELVHNSSDSDDNAHCEQIIRADYFAVDDDRFGSEKFGPGGDKGGRFLERDPEFEVGFEGIEAGFQISEEVQLYSKVSEEFRSGSGKTADSSNMKVGFEGIGEFGRGSEKKDSFVVSGSDMEVGFEGIEAGDRVSDGAFDQTELGFGGVHGTEGSRLECVPIGKVDSFLVDDSQAELEVEEIQLSHESSEEFRSGNRKGDSCIVDCLRMEVGFEGIEEFEHGSEKRDSFLVNVSKMEVGLEGSEAGDRVYDEAKDQIELGFRGVVDGSDGSNSEGIRTGEGVYFLANDSQLELGVEDSHEFHSDSGKGDSFVIDDSGMGAASQGIDEKFGSGSEKGDSFLANRSEMELGTEEIERDQTELEFGGVEGSEGSNSEIIPFGEGEKKGIVWWKLPMEILKFYVFRMRPIWSIPIAAAVIGIVMMGRRLYRMKHKSRRVPLNVSFEDKKAASKVLLRAARLNEAVVRRVSVVRSPLPPASGVTPWPLLALL